MCYRFTDPIGNSTFMLIVVPPQGQGGSPTYIIRTMIIDQEVKWVFKNRIGQEPGPYSLSSTMKT